MQSLNEWKGEIGGRVCVSMCVFTDLLDECADMQIH